MMSSPSARSSSSSYPGILLRHENTKEHDDSLSNPDDILSQPEDTLPHLAALLSQPKDSAMSSRNRSQYRNVHIFNESNPSTTIGGLILTNGITNANLYTMIEIIIIVTSEFTIRNESGITVEKDDSPLGPGNYYIDSPREYLCNNSFIISNVQADSFEVNNEVPLVRTISLGTGTRIQAFRDAVRLRDRQCVIAGEKYLDDDDWVGLEVAHIFPLAYEQYWKLHNYGRWISITPDVGGSINSVQNGLLLESGIHQLFDMYRFSINPDVCVCNFIKTRC
jgi:HNH endonuclease